MTFFIYDLVQIINFFPCEILFPTMEDILIEQPSSSNPNRHHYHHCNHGLAYSSLLSNSRHITHRGTTNFGPQRVSLNKQEDPFPGFGMWNWQRFVQPFLSSVMNSYCSSMISSRHLNGEKLGFMQPSSFCCKSLHTTHHICSKRAPADHLSCRDDFFPWFATSLIWKTCLQKENTEKVLLFNSSIEAMNAKVWSRRNSIIGWFYEIQQITD